jgi:hypothetical protein
MSSSFVRNITICILSINVLTGCSTGVMGESIFGRPGSPVWFGTASQATVIDYYKKTCISYGYIDGTTEMASCIQNSISVGRDQAETRKMNSLKTLDNMERQERERNTPQTGGITCYQQGYFTHCN